jgi:hypothetical protein
VSLKNRVAERDSVFNGVLHSEGKFYVRSTGWRTDRSYEFGPAFASGDAESVWALYLKFIAFDETDLRNAKCNVPMNSREPALRPVKSLDVLSDKVSNSGSSADMIALRSKHTTRQSSRCRKVDGCLAMIWTGTAES